MTTIDYHRLIYAAQLNETKSLAKHHNLVIKAASTEANDGPVNDRTNEDRPLSFVMRLNYSLPVFDTLLLFSSCVCPLCARLHLFHDISACSWRISMKPATNIPHVSGHC